MALTKHGGGITDIVGKFAGQVHSKDNSGSHISAHYYRNKQPTPAQSKRRRWFSRLIKLWQTTDGTAENTGKWSFWSKNHPRKNKNSETFYMSPMMSYLSHNLIRVMNSLDPVAVPPGD